MSRHLTRVTATRIAATAAFGLTLVPSAFAGVAPEGMSPQEVNRLMWGGVNGADQGMNILGPRQAGWPGVLGDRVKVFDREGPLSDPEHPEFGTTPILRDSSVIGDSDHSLLSATTVIGQNTGVVPGAQALGMLTTGSDADWPVKLRQLGGTAGDVFLFEAQWDVPVTVGGQTRKYLVPIELQSTDGRGLFVNKVLRAVTDSGINVVEAAGNGGANLSWDGYAKMVTQDSGAIIVGAGHPIQRSGICATGGQARQRMGVSTYSSDPDTMNIAKGLHVHVQGPGDCIPGPNVKETQPGVDVWMWNGRRYRYYYATSGATAVVAGVTASLSSMAKAYFGRPATPDALRAALVRTATPQTQATEVEEATGRSVSAGIGGLVNLGGAAGDLADAPDTFITGGPTYGAGSGRPSFSQWSFSPNVASAQCRIIPDPLPRIEDMIGKPLMDWVPCTDRYTYAGTLAPGTYKYQVRALRNDGKPTTDHPVPQVDPTPAERTFTVS